MVFNLQPYKLCKDVEGGGLSIKFTHRSDWRINFKKTLLGGHGKARSTVNTTLDFTERKYCICGSLESVEKSVTI